jgi:hypothetical protein
MKSLDLTPTNENVYNSLINDSIGRGEFVRQFVKMLNAIEDNCTIALEGNWGSGKTFFVKQVKMVLDAHNPNYQPVNGFLTEERRKVIKEKCSEFNAEDGSTELKPQLCVYYDAWQNDNDEDPILSLVYSIVKEIGSDFSFDKKPTLDICSELINLVCDKDISKLIKVLKGENALDLIKKTKDEAEKVSEFLQSLLPEVGERLIVFVDELDRCKPSYAVKLLERIKHYFLDEEITFVFSVNINELQHTIKKHYGSDFDATRYLDRFFDLRAALPKLDLEKYYATIDFKRNDDRFNYVCASVINKYQFEMRNIAKYIRLAKIAVPKSVRKGDMLFVPEKSALFIYNIYVIPIMIGLKLTDAKRFENFVNGKDCTPLLDFQKCFSMGCFVDLAFERYEKSSNDKAAAIEKKIKEIYDAIFVEKYEDESYRLIGSMYFDKKTKNSVMCIAGLMSSSANFDEE